METRLCTRSAMQKGTAATIEEENFANTNNAPLRAERPACSCASPAIKTPAQVDPSSCTANSSVSYLFDGRTGDSQSSGHGLLEGTTSGSVAETFTYDSFGELATQLVTLSGTPFQTTTYHSASAPRDALGRVTTRFRHPRRPDRSTAYGYDDKGQLRTIPWNAR